MSAFLRVWRRAPLWRLCLFGAGAFLALSILYPAPYLTPVLKRVWPGFQNAGPAPAMPRGNPDAEQVAQPPSDVPAVSGIMLPLTTTLTGSVPLSGHTLPLPAGEWHPVLSINDHPPHAELYTVYVRTDRGVVTGLMVTSALAHPVPQQDFTDVTRNCHDDRSFDRAIVGDTNAGTTCWAVFPFSIHDTPPEQADNPTALAITRLHALGYPIPPMMIAVFWLQTTIDAHGMMNAVSVVTMISPTQIGSTIMLAPLDGWTSGTLQAYPAAHLFLSHAIDWTHAWAGLLAQSRKTPPLDLAHIPASVLHDPAAP